MTYNENSQNEERIPRTTLDRIARLLDEMGQRGVPDELLKPLLDWLESYTPKHLRG